jgi:23S rRNA (cytidine1920-2'-O)/16S rRNA (cytidine1409-2'-O)-methyltransferase
MPRERLDRWMVEHSLAETRERAQALIMAGSVMVNGQKAQKPGQLLPDNPRVEVTERLRFVSRGGLKMEGALQHWNLSVEGLVCGDFGSSTGGFTDCLLQAGAAKVYAIDTGTGQLDWRLRTDPRVVVREGVNARHLPPGDLGEPLDFAVCDVSFISATMIVPVMAAALKPDAQLVVLVKPQFEVGKGKVGKGGIVRDPALHTESCDKVRACVDALGFVTDIIESPITGAEGNKEFLLYGRRFATNSPT